MAGALEGWPDYGLVMPRATFDHLLIERAQKAGARLLERTEAVEPIVDGGWVTGARVRPADDRDSGADRGRGQVHDRG